MIRRVYISSLRKPHSSRKNDIFHHSGPICPTYTHMLKMKISILRYLCISLVSSKWYSWYFNWMCSLLSFPNVNSSFTKSSLIQGHFMKGDMQLALSACYLEGLEFQLTSLSSDRTPEAKASHSSGSRSALSVMGAISPLWLLTIWNVAGPSWDEL